MANEEHVRILRQGVDVWNEWKSEHFSIPSILTRLRSSEAPHSTASLFVSDFSGADLSGANLSGANLIKADLSGANLSSINLFGADLSGADLSGADLSRTDLSKAVLSGADLSGAHLKQARLSETIFGDTNLNGAKELEQCSHLGPSTIDMRTLRKSWPLPLPFLRGCGLDDTFIEYLPSLVGQAIELYSCFISYSSKNQDFAERLHADLQNKGVRCWFAPEDLKIGAKTRSAIDKAIRRRDKLLVIFSEEAVDSDWVETEVETAFAEERGRGETMLFPVRIDDAVMETKAAWVRHIKDTRHIGDFRSWKDHDSYQKSFKRLLRDLRASGNQ